MRTILIYNAFNHSNAMKAEGMGTYPGYINRIVEESRESCNEMEVSESQVAAEPAD